MKIALCQLNPVTGDIIGNTKRIKDVFNKVKSESPDLIIFPELFISGYPPSDLLENSWFIANSLSSIDELCALSMQCPDTGIITGIALPDNVPNGRGLFNTALLITEGKILFHQNKTLLPTYDVFDESRYFDQAPEIELIEFKGEKLGITICEDAWNSEELWEKQRYNTDPVKILAEKGATLMINISASPFHLGKGKIRLSVIQNHAKRHNIPFVFVNMVGANDELIFDGCSMFLNASGELCELLSCFKEEIKIIDTANTHELTNIPRLDSISHAYKALVLGVKDYTRKCGFKKVLIGLSGGIDSAVTCSIAADALGPENVLGVTMPSMYSSPGSINDSAQLAQNLGIEFKEIPIKPIYTSFLKALSPHFNNYSPDITEENLQARIRSNILMGLSNKYGSLLLTTGNKSELAVGYCTLYGDMSGGLSVISDVYKTMVYKIAKYINRKKEIIPRKIIEKAPSAELKPDQVDQDSLPPYEILDSILKMLIEKNASTKDIIKKGFKKDTVSWVIKAIGKNEYKRRQSAPGLKITQKAFGSGRRFPIAAKYTR
ncbi:MAG: NAD+ synthase [Chitinispirillia bacterium]|jgi:NAD+ synthase (glutamine-hydrolysing)